MSFTDGDRLCNLFGMVSKWLESGEGHEFQSASKFFDCESLFFAFLENGIGYDHLYFVLTDADGGDAAIIGAQEEKPNDIPVSSWRYDVLVNEIPIHTHVGGTGRSQRREFADLMVALHDPEIFPQPVWPSGCIVTEAQYFAAMNGEVHPATILHRNFRSESKASHWHQDFWSFERGNTYTKSYGEGRKALLAELAAKGITTDEKYAAHIRKRAESWRIKRR